MENSLEYTLFIRNFVENILLSLNFDYKNYIEFDKKESLLKKKIDYHNIDTTISHIAYNLLIKGKQKIYFYDKDSKIIISMNYHKEEKVIGKMNLKFPRKIMSCFRRRKILYKLKKMNYLSSDNYKDNNYTSYSLFIMELIKKNSVKLTKDYSSVNSNSEKCTDQYILFREIRKRKYQKMLVNYIFDELNKAFHKFLNITDDDNIAFVSQSLGELYSIEDDLLSNKKKVSEILKMLYPWRN